jgi:hypothetical protein
MEQRDERIIVETDRHRIRGVLRLPTDGYRSRLTDYLNSSEREFLALTDVEVTTLDGTNGVERPPAPPDGSCASARAGPPAAGASADIHGARLRGFPHTPDCAPLPG